jgi:hypothetical protein
LARLVTETTHFPSSMGSIGSFSYRYNAFSSSMGSIGSFSYRYNSFFLIHGRYWLV